MAYIMPGSRNVAWNKAEMVPTLIYVIVQKKMQALKKK